jgi:HK97 family phage major capsid protein
MSTEITTKVTEIATLVEQLKSASEAGQKDLAGKLATAVTEHKAELDAIKLTLAESSRADSKKEEKAKSAHDKAFKSFMRSGADVELKTVQGIVATSADGGYAVPSVIDTNVTRLLQETSDIRTVAKIVTIGPQTSYIHNISQSNAGFAWGTESTANGTSNSPTLGQITITPGTLKATPEVSLQLVEDANFDVESWYAMEVADVISRAENTAFVSGSGTNQPKGWLQYTTNAVTSSNAALYDHLNTISSGTAATVSANDIYALVYAIKPAYRRNATFVMNRAIIQQVMQLKSTTGQYLWQQSLQAGQPSLLVGYPVVEASDMPAVTTTGTNVITFGDFSKGYVVVDRVGLSVMRNPYLNPGFVQFYTRKRTGGGLEDGTALITLVTS